MRARFIGFKTINNQSTDDYYIDRLSDADQKYIQRIQAGLPITADISRADILVCGLRSPSEAEVIQHGKPNSVISLYEDFITGQIVKPEDQPLLFRSLIRGYPRLGQRKILNLGAPVVQQAYPIFSTHRTGRDSIIGAMLIETNMIAHQRHRRRHRDFRQALVWLQQMCLRGELANAQDLSHFSLYDGVYLIDSQRRLSYMSGIATNMFRSIGLTSHVRTQLVSTLEKEDEQIVKQAFQTQSAQETRQEVVDGRVWTRKAIPIRASVPRWRRFSLQRPWSLPVNRRGPQSIDAVLVLIHNATEAVQNERELNVKSAIIQELHHRVKNNLQTVTAILRMQSRRTTNEETRHQLTEAVHRIFSMSVIHEFLSQDERQSINIRKVCQRIADQITQVTSHSEQHIQIRVSGPNIRLLTGQATTTSLVVNELLLNALEHGLRDRTNGRITMELEDLGDRVRLVVQDDGHGLPIDFDLSQNSSLGLQILQTLVTDDLKGQLQMNSLKSQSDPTQSPHGTKVVVEFPK